MLLEIMVAGMIVESKVEKILAAINNKYGTYFGDSSYKLVLLEGYPDACLFNVIDADNNVVGRDYFIRHTDLREKVEHEEVPERRVDKNGVIPFNYSIQ